MNIAVRQIQSSCSLQKNDGGPHHIETSPLIYIESIVNGLVSISYGPLS